MADRLTHFDERGRAQMVDVSAKGETERVARAGCRVVMAADTMARIREGTAEKGDVLGVARLAGIMAAKRTGDLIPLCHPIPITSVTVDLVPRPDLPELDITAEVRTRGRTGVEMEAMTAASVAALTVYDMLKAVDRGIRIEGLRLLYKAGGKSGVYEAPE